MEGKKKSPELRFPGFTEEWTLSKLGDIGDVKMCKRIFNNQTTEKGNIPFYKIGTFGKKADAFISKELYQEFREKYSFPKKGDILISASGTVGRTVIYDGKPAYFQDSNIVWINNDESKVLNEFLYYVYENISYDSEGGTIKRLYNNIILNAKFSYPSSKESQKLVLSFFKNIDELITKHQKKYNRLVTLKKSMLEKMFPKDGQVVPEIRFKGFEGEWEEIKLGSIADIVRGASPRPIKDPKWFDNKSEIGWLRISDVTEQDGKITYLEQRISQAGEEKTRVLNTPHLLLSIAASVGKPVINYVKTGVHDGFLIFLSPEFDIDFMFYWMKMFESQWQQYGQPGSQVNLNSEIVKNHLINIPIIEEQRKIGGYFLNLDQLIGNHKKQLQKLKNFKQSLSEKMFV